MKRKCLLLLTLLVLSIFLSGCSGGIVTPSTDEAKIKSVINEYFSALNEQDWDKAKSYCVVDSIWDDFVSYLETGINENINDTYILEYSLSINSFYFITGCTCPPLAIVFGELLISLAINGKVHENLEEIITFQKINNNWQLFSDELPAGLVI